MRPWIQYFVVLALAPLLPGIINRVKALFAGRRGQPLLQLYYDLWKLLHKTPVYSRTTTWIFRAGPLAGLCALLTALAVLPFAGRQTLVSFDGDFLLLAYLLALTRFAAAAAALDTGSAFEGMGASREVQFAVFAEPALFLSLAALSRATGAQSLTGVFLHLTPASWQAAAPVLALVTVALFVVLLAENCRVPADDPNTHLELTMVHEVMVLDHSGPELACILYAASLKLWLFGALIACAVLPRHTGSWFYDGAAFLLMMFALAAAVGAVESAMARLRLFKVPYLLMGGLIFSVLALLFQTGR